MRLIDLRSHGAPKGKLIIGMCRGQNTDEFFLCRRIKDNYYTPENKSVSITHWADIGMNEPFICADCHTRSYDWADYKHRYCKCCKAFTRHAAKNEEIQDE